VKQHITEEQFNELSFHASNMLADWMGKHKYKNVFPTIGQMIEFLDEHLERHGYIDQYHDHNIVVGEAGWNGDVSIGWNDYEELCDALWEAVKEVLNSPE
jgi:hypothetical protein